MSFPKSDYILAYHHQVRERMNALNEAIRELDVALENETKSSAGDKHETARARLQTEQQNLQKQLQDLHLLLEEISTPAFKAAKTVCLNGALVVTSMGTFLIGPAMGKVSINGVEVFAISLRSPLGLQLQAKSAGMPFELNGKQHQILSIE
jgi:transcription elongation GreA/GreB family factor